MRQQNERKLQVAAIKMMRLMLRPDVLMWHTPNGGFRNAREAANLKRAGVVPGVLDISFLAAPEYGSAYGCECMAPNYFELELKTPGGRLSKAQHERMQKLEALGAYAACADSLGLIEKIVKSWGLCR